MAGDKERKSRPIPFAGGSLTDQPVAGQEAAYDLENLLPPSGGGRGLIPRDGIEHVVGLTTDDTSGHVIHKVTLDDVARTELIVVSSAETGRVELITDHTDMEGLQSVPPRGGGELPDTDPAVFHPVMLMIDSEDFGENTVYTAQAIFWSAESNSLTDTVDMSLGTGVTDDGNRFRTENYLCLCQGDGDVILSAYKLADIDPDQSNAPTRTLTVYNDGSKTSFLKQIYPYAGDIVFILDDVGAGAYTPEGPHDYRLYKVDLATGTVSDTALTGLPEDMVGFCSGPWYGSSTVDANGDLWATGYSYGDNDYIIKINPATSVCTYLGTTSHNSSDQETGCFAVASGGVMCLPDDDYSIRKYDNALTTETVVSTDSMYVNTTYSNANSLLGNKTISEADSVPGIFDFTTGVKATSLVFDAGAYPEAPPSVYDSGTFACMVYYYESGGSSWRLEFVDATTGEVTVGDGPRSLNGIMIQDAFGYGVKHIQGSRL